jgi:hypothetical protein
MKRSLRSWLWRVPIEQEIDEELSLHVDMRTRELVERGMDPTTARDVAMSRLGDLADLKRTMTTLGRKRDREMRVTLWLEELRDDLKFAFRQLRNSPAFTLVATLTLALGIGANSAIFALVDATLLRPLPYGEPDRLVSIWERSAKTPRGFVSPLNMIDWGTRSRTFEKIAGFTPSVGQMVMPGADGNSETISRQWVTAGIFDVLGVKPLAGRTFSADDENTRANVVVLSEGLWRAKFNGDSGVVGRQIRLDGALWTIVGIVPANFELLGQTSVWAMRPFVNLPPRARGAYMLQVVGRMKPGVSIAAAEADLATVAEALSREFPETNKGRGVTLEGLHDSMIGSDLRLTSMLFLGVVGFVLLICCANVANLLLARATVRTSELAVRSALGAGRRRIVRQLLTESVVLSLVGGALGIGIGAAILSVAPSLIPRGLLPATVTLTFDARVVAFCATAALLVGLLFGVMPAWKATEFSSADVIRSGSRATAGGGHLRGLLVIGEVATAVLLLFGAGLLLRTLIAVEAFDRGYRAESVLSMLVDPLGSKYPTAASLQQFYDQVETEVSAVPGVASVAWASALPLDFFDEGGRSFEIVGDPPARRQPASEHRVSSRQPDVFLDTRLADLAGPRLRSTRHARRHSSLHRERSLRSNPFTAGRRWPAGRAAAGVVAAGEAGRARDRRRGAPGERAARRGQGVRADLRADGAGSCRRYLSRRAADVRTGGSPGAFSPPRNFPRRQGTARRRHQRDDARGHRVGGDGPSSVPCGDGRGLCRSGVGAVDGRRLRDARLRGSAARPRLRCAPGARCDDQRRPASRGRPGRAGRRRGDRDRAGAVGALRPPDPDDAVRSAAAGSGHVCVRDDRARHHGRAVARRARLAGGADRSRGRAAEPVAFPQRWSARLQRIFNIGVAAGLQTGRRTG